MQTLPDMTKETAAATAKWWTDHLRSRTRWDNGGDLRHTAMVARIQSHSTAAPELVDKLEAAMTAEILRNAPTSIPRDDQAAWEAQQAAKLEGKIRYDRARASVDYHPEHALKIAIRAAGAEALEVLLPCKSDTQISSVGVTGRCGYGAASVSVFELYERQPIERWFVVDRWDEQASRVPASWRLVRQNAEQGREYTHPEHAQLVWVGLAQDCVSPIVCAYVLRGICQVDNFGDYGVEHTLVDGFRHMIRDGYLAAVVPRDMLNGGPKNPNDVDKGPDLTEAEIYKIAEGRG